MLVEEGSHTDWSVQSLPAQDWTGVHRWTVLGFEYSGFVP